MLNFKNPYRKFKMFVNFVGPVGRLGLLGFKLMEIDASQRGIFGHLVKMVVHGRFYEHLSIPPKTYLLREPQHPPGIPFHPPNGKNVG